MRNNGLKCLGVAPAAAQWRSTATHSLKLAHIVVPFFPGFQHLHGGAAGGARDQRNPKAASRGGEQTRHFGFNRTQLRGKGAGGCLLIRSHLKLDNVPYDALKDFAPISLFSGNTYVSPISSKLPHVLYTVNVDAMKDVAGGHLDMLIGDKEVV